MTEISTSEPLKALINIFGPVPDGLIWVGGHRDGWAGRCFTTPEEAADYAEKLDRQGRTGQGVYVRPTTLKHVPTKVENGVEIPAGRGEAVDSAAVHMFVADLDVNGPGHASDRYPNTFDEVNSIVVKAGLGTPTRWIHSGGGYYPQWQLKTPVDVRDSLIRDVVQQLWRDLTGCLIKAAADLGRTDGNPGGWKVDNTSNLAHVYRIPGTTNRKAQMSEPVTCSVVADDGPTYTLDELRAFLPVRAAAGDLFDTPHAEPEGGEKGQKGTDETRTPRDDHDGVWNREQATAEVGRMLDRIASAPKGRFNETLSTSALRVGRFIPGLHSRTEAERALEGAVGRVFAAPDANDKATIKSGLNKGEKMPFEVTEDKPKGKRPANDETKPKQTRPRRAELETFGPIKLADLAEPVLRGQFRWCAELGWLHHDGTRWVPDAEPAALRALVGVIKQYTLDLLNQRGLGRDDYDELKSLSGSTTQNHALKLLRAAPGIITTWTDFDAPPKPGQPWTVPTSNGWTIELHADGTRNARRTTPADMNTKTTCAYDPDATAPNIGMAFTDYQPDEDVRRFKLQLWCRALSGMGAENFVADIGAGGGNGKGTMAGLVAAVFGDYSAELPVEVILKSNVSARSEFRSELAGLRGCRHIFCEEPDEDARYDLGILKKITGGGTLDGRAMRKESIKFKAAWLFEMAANKRPTWPADDAMTRRYVEISWDFSIIGATGGVREDFKEALKAEAPGFLNAILAHWTGTTKPVAPAVVKQQTVTGAAASSPIAPFVEGALIRSEGAKVGAETVYQAYLKWASSSSGGVRVPMTNTKFGRELPRFFRKEPLRAGTFYCDVEIRPAFDPKLSR